MRTGGTQRAATMWMLACALSGSAAGCATTPLPLWPMIGNAAGEVISTAKSPAEPGRAAMGLREAADRDDDRGTRQVAHEAPEVTEAFERLGAWETHLAKPATGSASEQPIEHQDAGPGIQEASHGSAPQAGWSPAATISGPGWIPDAPLRR